MDAGWVERVDDEELVARAADGEGAAFAELVRRHHGEVYALAVRLGSDPELAADITQETFIRAWRALPKFRREAAFSTWLYRITVNTTWSWRRKVERHRAARLEDAEPIVETHHANHPEYRAEAADIGARIRAALDRLPAGSRAVVVLKDVYGWSHSEIAAALGLTVTATKVRLHRARARLQAELEELR